MFHLRGRRRGSGRRKGAQETKCCGERSSSDQWWVQMGRGGREAEVHCLIQQGKRLLSITGDRCGLWFSPLPAPGLFLPSLLPPAQPSQVLLLKSPV